MTLKIGVIGTGAIGRTHIERINNQLQGGKVVAACDDHTDFGKSIAQQYGLKSFDTPEALVASDEVDAIVIATGDATHEKHVLSAIAAGKYVFCEKPLAPSVEGCKNIVEAEMAGGKKLVQVGFMRRYDPGYNQLKKYIDDRTFGNPLILHCAHRNPSVPDDWTTEMSVENSLVHEIDCLRWLTGEEYASVEVVFPKTTENANDGVRDPQILILTTKSGVRIDVESFVNCKYGYDIQCDIVCEEGVIKLPEPPNAMIRSNASRITPICDSWSQRFVDAYNIEFQAWINASLAGKVDGPDAWDGYVCQSVASQASVARDTQEKVHIQMDTMPDFYQA